MVVRQLQHNKEADLYPVAFVDDDRNKQKLEIYNVPVVGTTNHIQEIVENNDIEHIIIAIPSLNRNQINEILRSVGKQRRKRKLYQCLKIF